MKTTTILKAALLLSLSFLSGACETTGDFFHHGPGFGIITFIAVLFMVRILMVPLKKNKKDKQKHNQL